MQRLTPRTWRRAAAITTLAVAGSLGLAAIASPRGGMGMMPMMGQGLKHMLDDINATDAQRTQIEQITTAARADMKAQHAAAGDLRAQAMALFTQPSVDATAAEALRQQMLTEHDQASKRMMQAMLDVSSVLTQEQRQQVAEKMQQRAAKMREHQNDRRGPGAQR